MIDRFLDAHTTNDPDARIPFSEFYQTIKQQSGTESLRKLELLTLLLRRGIKVTQPRKRSTKYIVEGIRLV